MFEKLESVARRSEELTKLLSDPAVFADPETLRRHAKEQADLRPVVSAYHEYRKRQQELQENQELLDSEGQDSEFTALIKEEMAALTARLATLETELRTMLLPRDPNDERGVIMEIRAGTGGDEAALFAADLFRMYSRYADSQRWRVEVMNASPTETGGFKEVIASIEGKDVYRKLKFESGTHRVQRVPATEAQGRIHTSAVTVAILPEAEEVEVDIDPADLRIDVFRSSGPGGQSVNTTDSAVRVTYEPKDRKGLRIVVTCQDDGSPTSRKTAKGCALSSPVRTRSRSTKTVRKLSKCCARGSWTSSKASVRPSSPSSAAPRLAAAIVASVFGHTISPRVASPTIVSSSPCISSRISWKGGWTR